MLYGLAFTGDNATIIANREGWELKPEYRNDKWAMEAVPHQEGKNYHEEHVKNFLECIKSRKEPNCPVETGRIAAIYAHLGNLAFQTGSTLQYDMANNVFTGNKEATKMITPEYREPWSLPNI
jgi:hypothetical protein